MTMTQDSMSERRFAALADAHGGDLARWPAAERAAAAALARRSAAAQAALARAAALDAALDALAAAPPPAASARLLAACAADAAAVCATRRRARRPVWAGLAAAAALGVALGASDWLAAAVGPLDAAAPSPEALAEDDLLQTIDIAFFIGGDA